MESIVAPTLSLPRTWLENKDEYQTTKSNAWIYQCIFWAKNLFLIKKVLKNPEIYCINALELQWDYVCEIMYPWVKQSSQ